MRTWRVVVCVALVAAEQAVLVAAPVRADRAVREYHWTELAKARKLPGRVVRAAGQPFSHALQVVNTASALRRVPLLTIDAPGIVTPTWSVRGSVQYQDVHGKAFLELWNHFPDGSRYFSRTLADVGPLKHLGGTSGWRPFVLPFFSKNEMPAPSRLEINLVLPGAGTVWLSALTLVEYQPGENPLQTPP